MGQALYRSYRSKSFDEVVGQEHITKTLKTAVESGRISHAYLFTGPRGVGKTSVARILAHEVNQLPYTGEAIHLDIIEIDAASNRRIDEIRELRDKVHIAPSSAKYKVYIIDEVHMLTREAFNALLKTLEEPPEHCIFILATTEAHKLPETIISRTQRFIFKPIDPKQAAAHLAAIAKREKINIDKEALDIIAEHSEGSFRDSISLLDQLSSIGKHITVDDVRHHFGLPAASAVDNLLNAIDANKPAEVLSILDSLNEQAADSLAVSKALAARLRTRISAGNTGPRDFYLLKELLLIAVSPQPSESLEILLLEVSSPDPAAAVPIQPAPAAPIIAKTPAPTPPAEVVQKKTTPSKIDNNFDLSMWEDVLTAVKSQAASLYTALRLAAPEFSDGHLTLYFEFALHQKKVNQAAHRDIVVKCIDNLCGDKVILECLIDKDRAKALAAQEAPDFYKPAEADSGSLTAISNIFGNAEVLES